MNLQTALRVIYPPRCLGCGGMVDGDGGLCPECWRNTPFITGLACDACGAPLPGHSDRAEYCDDCLATPRPWDKGRAALVYNDRARAMVLALKHGDRQDIAEAAAGWLARAAAPLIQPHTLIAPIPLHWLRLVKRRYNQSALLARGLSARTGLPHCPDLLVRTRRTKPLEGHSKDARFAELDAAIAVHPRRRHKIAGRPVLLIDDVMTSGATLTAATHACRQAGAAHVCVLTLARVAKRP